MSTLFRLLPLVLALALSLALWLRLSRRPNVSHMGLLAFYVASVALPVQLLWGAQTFAGFHMAPVFPVIAAATTLIQNVTAAVLLDVDETKDRFYGAAYLVVATFAVYSLFAR